MSRETVVTIDFSGECIVARSAIGEQHAGELRWDAPSGPAFWATEDGHALIQETLAITHLPNVDALVLILPDDEVGAHRSRLELLYTGLHDVRNTECRSQRLRVRIRRVCVVPRPSASPAAAKQPT